MTHRLYWQDFTNFTRTRPGEVPKQHYQDFDTETQAHAEAANLKSLHSRVVTSVRPVVEPRAPIRSQKVGPGHPEYQGERRMTR